ncbi:MAG: hypothetical protein LBO21_04460 [Synergistaceae bacterium]|jgi:hypothetical protein|nr:hypothetical protein [Synergistaceae bacterium]
MTKKFPKMMLLAQAALLMLLAATAAWGSVENGVLTSNQDDVDLSILGYYKEGTAYNEITLGSTSVNVVGNVKLGGTGLKGYAVNYNDVAEKGNAGGAIYLKKGDTLNFIPLTGKGIKGVAGSSLRLFGQGTTNIRGEDNDYSFTFIQSGTLNIESAESLGGSILTMGGGSTLGIAGGDVKIDLSGVTINVRRYNSEGAKAEGATETVTFDTGGHDTNEIILPKIKQLTAWIGSDEKIVISKRGKGRLVLSDVLEHTGDTVVEEGELEIKSSPNRSQTVEIKPGAALVSTKISLNTLNIKPHSDAVIILPQSNGTAELISEKAGPAALDVLNIDPEELTDNGSFTIKADLSGVSRPEGVDEDKYYVKLISSTDPNGLEESDVRIEGAVRPAFAESYYAVRPYVDGYGIYALLSKDVRVNRTIDVKVLRSGKDAIVTAALSDERSGVDVTFEIRNSVSERLGNPVVVSSDGGLAEHVFSNLSMGDYVVSVSAAAYLTSEKKVTIDGTTDPIDTDPVPSPASLDVTISDVYNVNQSSDVTAVRIKGGAPLSEGTFKYSFIEIGGTRTENVLNPVKYDTIFTAKDVLYDPDDPLNALFYIDRNNLVADDGHTYQLVPGVRYKLVVSGGASGSGDSSDTLMESGGIYVPSGKMVLVTYAKPVSSDSIAAWAVAKTDGEPQVDKKIFFSLLDIFGNPVNISGIPNDQPKRTDANGRADVIFRHLPYGRYIIRATAENSPYVGYSRAIEFREPSSGGGGGGCASFSGIFAVTAVLFAAFASKFRRRGK